MIAQARESPPEISPASFRDPAGRLLKLDGRIIRLLTDPRGIEEMDSFLAFEPVRAAVSAGDLVETWALSGDDADKIRAVASGARLIDLHAKARVFEHARIPFPSYAYEWAPEMLHAAGALTIDLATRFLSKGYGLKDATPYNVLFRGTKPVFVDIPSFERRDKGDKNWLAYGQFIRTFLMPLLANKHFGLSLDQLLLVHRDGLEPQDVYRLTGPLERLLPPFLGLVSLPSWLSSNNDGSDKKLYEKKLIQDHEKADFILRSMIRGLERSLAKLEPPKQRDSTWSGYMEQGGNNYTAEHQNAKQAFVEQAIREVGAKRVLDVGCNTGTFSFISAQAGASVVAIDFDPVVVGQVWRDACAKNLDVLPLVQNITRPSPAVGWRYGECASFLDRARGSFDAVLMLAVIHHLIVTERIPLEEIIELAAEMTKDALIIEFVSPQDSMFQRLTRGRDHLHVSLTPQVFEAACRPYFDQVRVQHVEGSTRWLYLLRKRTRQA
jgi:SAM-dependent methyltransferase